MEVEAKFALTQPVTAVEIEALPWAPYMLGTQHVAEQHDVFWDTVDRQLSHTHHAVRLRQVDNRLITTLKGPGKVENGVHTRDEWEGEATAQTPDGWPQAIRARVQDLIGTQPLAPLLEVHVRRHTWPLLRDNRVIGELALDQGEIVAGGRRLALHELEIELKGGELDDLGILCAVVQRHLPAQPEDRSKFARGLALLADE